ncbi:hypothetical protein CCOS865_02263 [Pseudomonas reidholzensis]|uniref:DUF3077 domain-containing protein n=1 Tax=Pseudomonas reidholzensis TaxID=1785162 RepID=A0A383RSE5_9PSED|nr:DUF3077 domain-containing protein [Pseudomonas reidholzensis]SYX89997.1 hypothetical protein CCOS865_02263 [Pseudomonas reidholzensis]
MEKDDQPKHAAGLKVVSVVGRVRKGSHRDWVQAVPGLPAREVLQETLQILACITGLSKKALENPAQAKPLLRATYYLSGMAKAMIDGQIPGLRGEAQGKEEMTPDKAETETE